MLGPNGVNNYVGLVNSYMSPLLRIEAHTKKTGRYWILVTGCRPLCVDAVPEFAGTFEGHDLPLF
jgi:hypothetical protein